MRGISLLLFAALAGHALAVPCNYKLSKGDTLFDIAEANDLNVTDIAAINPEIADPENVIAGTVIRLPCKGEHSRPPSALWALPLSFVSCCLAPV
jgi:hypothetical protein